MFDKEIAFLSYMLENEEKTNFHEACHFVLWKHFYPNETIIIYNNNGRLECGPCLNKHTSKLKYSFPNFRKILLAGYVGEVIYIDEEKYLFDIIKYHLNNLAAQNINDLNNDDLQYIGRCKYENIKNIDKSIVNDCKYCVKVIKNNMNKIKEITDILKHEQYYAA